MSWYSGETTDHRSLPVAVAEHILAKTYGWSLKEIEELPQAKYQAHMAICMTAVRLEIVRTQQKAFLQAAKSMVPNIDTGE